MNPTMLTRGRSWLFTPATRPERFGNAAASRADVRIIDLEDYFESTSIAGNTILRYELLDRILRWLGYRNPILREAVLTTAIPVMPP